MKLLIRKIKISSESRETEDFEMLDYLNVSHAIHILNLLFWDKLPLFYILYSEIFTNFQTSESAVPQSSSRHSNVSSVADVTESWEFRSALEAPIAKLESLDEIDRQVRTLGSNYFEVVSNHGWFLGQVSSIYFILV